MHFPTVFAATAFASTVLAKEHLVSVSNAAGQLIFNPDSLTADQGDTVTFRFWPKNHSVAQAAFGSPCQPLKNGFWSGYIPDASNKTVAATNFTYTVKNSSAPIWFYCSQGEHCQAGMVGVINPPQIGNKTLAAFKNLAKSASSNVGSTSTPGTGGAFNQTSSNSSSSSSSSGYPTPSQTYASYPSSTGSSASGASRLPSSSTTIPSSLASAAASHLTGSVTFAGLAGLFSYFLL